MTDNEAYQLEHAMIAGLHLAVGARVGNLFSHLTDPSEEKIDPAGALERYTNGIKRTVHYYTMALEVIRRECNTMEVVDG
jgi:hypothetical protein